MTVFRAASATDVGNTRAVNQDAMYASETLLIVADGMGGHAGGEVASQSAVSELEEAFREHPTGKGLLAGTKVANRKVFERSEDDEELHGMGTTLVAAAIVPARGGSRIALMNVGDSRAYILEDGVLRQLTEDHSLVEEMLRQGEITQEAADVHPYRHVLTRAVGINERVDVDAWTLVPRPGTRLLLCSDGLTNECDDSVIAEILTENEHPADAASALIRRALDHGGNDNITAIVADVAGTETETETETETVAATPKPEQASRPKTPKSEKPSRVSIARARPSVTKNLGAQLITFRVALFSFVLILVLAGAVGFSIWFNKATYYVGVDNNNVAIFNGRPGGLLWFHPTLVTVTSVPLSKVRPANVALLRTGMLESSYDAATQTVSDLANNPNSAITATTTSTTTTSTTHG